MSFLFSTYRILRILRTVVRVAKFVATGHDLVYPCSMFEGLSWGTYADIP